MNNLVGVVLVLPFVLIALVVLLQVLERCLRALDSLLLARERSSSANRAAEVLLREFLTAAEYRHLCATGSLEIASPTQPGRVYRVPRGSGGVDVLEGRRCTEPHTHQLWRGTWKDSRR
jgi:hypothetical protein